MLLFLAQGIDAGFVQVLIKRQGCQSTLVNLIPTLPQIHKQAQIGFWCDDIGINQPSFMCFAHKDWCVSDGQEMNGRLSDWIFNNYYSG